MDPQEAASRSDHGITPALEQEDPRNDPNQHDLDTPAAGVGGERPITKLQENDPQTHVGHPERPPYELAAPGDTMGLGHIAMALDDLVFPVSRKDLLEQAGRWRIPTTGTHFHVLAEYLEGVDAERFRSANDVVRAIRKAHPELSSRQR